MEIRAQIAGIAFLFLPRNSGFEIKLSDLCGNHFHTVGHPAGLSLLID